MNKRAHIRHAVDMNGKLAGEGFHDQTCRIADFCLGGMLVLFDGREARPPSHLERGSPVAVTVQVDGTRGRRDITLPARVARTLDEGLGLSFDQPNPSDLLALQNQVRAMVDGGREARQRRPRVAPEPVLDSIRGLVHEHLEERLGGFFPLVREQLAAEADKALTNEEQHLWFEAGKVLAERAERLTRDFLRVSTRPLEALVAGAGAAAARGRTSQAGEDAFAGSGGKLSLVDKELFEDWLTLKVMASRAEGHMHEQLLPLQLRFDELLGISLSARRNPLHPAVFCSAFGEALKPLGLKKKTDRVVLAIFEAEVVSQLEALYRDVNAAMAEAGVLPDLDIGRYLSEHYPGSSSGKEETPEETTPEKSAPEANDSGQVPAEPGPSRTAPAASGPANRATVESATAVMEAAPQNAAGLFAQQQQIANQAYGAVSRILSSRNLSRVRSRQADDRASAPDAPVAPAEVVSRALERLQQDGTADAATPLPERVSQAVGEGGESPMALDSEVEAASEVIHHLFEGIAGNPALSESVRHAIKRLEVPFLRLLLMDEAFLQEDAHPARQVLNRIAHLGVRGSARLADHEQAINRHVEDVVHNFSNNINVFDDTLKNLDELVNEQKRLYQRNLKRVTESCEGRQKVVEARREVNRALEQRIGGRQVPRALLALVDAGWRELLVQTLLREGPDSDAWGKYLGVLDDMQVYATSVPDQTALSDLLSLIKQGLARVDETQTQNPALVAELRRLLSVKVRESEGPPPLAEVPAGMVDASDPVDVGDTDEQVRRWHRRAQRHEPGDWFDLGSDEDNVQQVRLAWTDTDRQLFVFVNHQGMKIQEFSLEEFATHLRDGRLTPIDSLDAPAVDRGLEVMVQRVYSQMAHQATHDELTGLLNRREFERRVRQRLASGEERVDNASLAHLDLDQFKVINNTAGPEAGDTLLRELGQLLHEAFPGLLTARLGGDEFAVWLEGIGPDAAVRAVELFKDRVESQRFSLGGQAQAVTFSGGLAQRQGPEDTAGNLMQAADSACQGAKESGRNRLHRYQPDDEQMAKRDDTMIWAARLTEALDRDQLQLRCQRIEPMNGDGPPAYEVLISVQGENGELIPPAEFVQAAERYNRMHAVDRWVITNVLRWMHAHPDVVNQVDHMSINLSGHSLNDPTLTEFLFEQFQRYPVPRGRVCFEVTETTAITSLEDAADFIQALQDMGCRFSLDDFGSGLASYRYLKHLPVNYIKIDGSFILDVNDDPADLALVRSINEMGHLMGKQTIAECVEDDAVRASLAEIGVDFVQGFGVERPRMLNTLAASTEPA